ncbi:MAG: PD40 domain-containing protein [Flavobacteriales bacterium]|nr:PD40 domain-containing protein [Flavobacteriales bacterium]
MRTLVIILLLILAGNFASAQWDDRTAGEFFKRTNFLRAMVEYHKGIKIDRDNLVYNYRLGICYLYTNVNKPKSLSYLKKAYENPKHKPETEFYLGRSLMLNLDFVKAKQILSEYVADPGKGKYLDQAKLLVENCDHAVELMKNPVNVSFKNMGKFINTEYPDYNPFVTQNEKIFLFTSRRESGKGRIEFDGYYPSDIYEVKFNGTNFTKAKNIGTVNTALDEEIVGLLDDGSKMFVYLDHNLGRKDDPYGDIYMSIKEGSSWKKRILIEEGVNTDHMEISCSQSPDGNTLIYSSNRPGGKGGYDVYMTRKLPNGKWGATQNIESINTIGNEEYPSFGPDGQTLYFSSNGHKGMGGKDIFQVQWNPNTNKWGEPKNLGYPINTPDDEETICFPANKKHAYISASREDSYGDLDIYRITFNDVLLNPALFITTISDEISGESLKDGIITVFNDQDDIIADFRPNKNSGVFTITLDPGTYSMEFELPGYPLKVVKWKVSEFDYQQGVIMKTVKISKLE